jgi:D-glycerate 3-kinase
VPINALEAVEDRDGQWRRHVNAALAGAYSGLFARIDRLIALRAPDFDIVAAWRTHQEAAMGPRRAMTDSEIRGFVAHFERLTRHMLAGGMAGGDLPAIVVALDRQRNPVKITES